MKILRKCFLLLAPLFTETSNEAEQQRELNERLTELYHWTEEHFPEHAPIVKKYLR